MCASEGMANALDFEYGLSVTSLQETKTNEGSFIVYITEKLDARQHAQNATSVLFATASLFRLTALFQIHLFLSI